MGHAGPQEEGGLIARLSSRRKDIDKRLAQEHGGTRAPDEPALFRVHARENHDVFVESPDELFFRVAVVTRHGRVLDEIPGLVALLHGREESSCFGGRGEVDAEQNEYQRK